MKDVLVTAVVAAATVVAMSKIRAGKSRVS